MSMIFLRHHNRMNHHHTTSYTQYIYLYRIIFIKKIIKIISSIASFRMFANCVVPLVILGPGKKYDQFLLAI